MSTTREILTEIECERERQTRKFGVQNHPIGNNPVPYGKLAIEAKAICDEKTAKGILTWVDIFREEFCEAMAEAEPEKIRTELVQTAAVVVAMIESLDRNGR